MNEELKQDLCLLLLSLLLLIITLPIIFPQAEAISLDEKQNIPQTKTSWNVIESKEEWKWTPVILTHVPRHGKATGATTWYWKTKFKVGPYGTITTKKHDVSVIGEDGECVGFFILAKWRYEHGYEHYTAPPDMFCTKIYKTKWYVVDWGEGLQIAICGDSKDTCEDDISSFEYDGYKSIIFYSKYLSEDWALTVLAGEHVEKIEIGYGEYFIFELDIKVSVGGKGPVSGTMSVINIKKYLFWGQTYTYEYHFYASHKWSIDYQKNWDSMWMFKLQW